MKADHLSKTSLILALLFILLSNANFAQNKWDFNFLTPSARNADGLHVADIDGDGDLDVLTSKYTDFELSNLPVWWETREETIEWYENLGDNTFETRYHVMDSLFGSGYLFLFDHDQDGDMDFVCASAPDSAGISLFLNDGFGQFSSPTVLAYEPVGVDKMGLNDLDGDGDLDIWWEIDYVEKGLKWAEKEGGIFLPPQLILSGFTDEEVFFPIDVNDDDLLDFINVTADSVRLIRNEGLGLFSDPLFLFEGEFGIEEVSVLDINGDARLDFAFDANNQHDWFWKENLGNEQFSSEQPLIESAWTKTEAIIAFDMDQDNDMDLISSDASFMKRYINDGNNSFSYGGQFQGIVNFNSILRIADMDADGIEDILVLNGSMPRGVTCYNGLGAGEFSFPLDVSSNANGASCTDIGDIDGDGINDVVSTTIYGELQWFEVDSEGAFQEKHIIEYNLYDIQTADLVDVDNDGDLDLIVAKNEYPHWDVYLYKNNGQGDFDEPIFLDLGSGGNNAQTAFRIKYEDVNNDGDLDLFIRKNVDELAWFENNGTGNFSIEHLICNPCEMDLGALINNFQMGDIDGDGDKDIVYRTKYPGNNIYFYTILNVGNGSFEGVQNLVFDEPSGSNDGGGFNFLLLDMNDDEHLDIVSTINGDLHWLLNDGSGNFPIVNSTGEEDLGCFDINAADFDFDGDLDIILSNKYFAHGVRYFEKLDSAAFAPSYAIHTWGLARYLSLGHMNDDDAIDLVTCTLGPGHVFSVLNPCGMRPDEPEIFMEDGTYYVEEDSLLTYQWYMDGLPLIGDTFSVLVPDTTGQYYVIVRDTNRCANTSEIIDVEIEIEEPNSLEESNGIELIDLYPNPVKDILQVKWPAHLDRPNWTILDIAGKQVQMNTNTMNWPNIDVRELSQGVYLLNYYNDGLLIGQSKFVKE
ncbi:MAG: T9SS type A sorting domain-containing protein [Bacteroidota bacterium]